MTTTITILISLLIILFLATKLHYAVKECRIQRDRAISIKHSLPDHLTSASRYYVIGNLAGSWEVRGVWDTPSGQDLFIQTIKRFSDPDESFNRREAQYLLSILREK